MNRQLTWHEKPGRMPPASKMSSAPTVCLSQQRRYYHFLPLREDVPYLHRAAIKVFRYPRDGVETVLLSPHPLIMGEQDRNKKASRP